MNLSSRYATLVLGLVLVLAPVAVAQTDPAREKRINSLIAQMTLAEKLGQLQQLDSEGNGSAHPEEFEMARKGLLGSTLGVRGAKFTNDLQRAALESRLKIPMLFGFDVIHGYRTLFPIPLALSCSWDPQMVEQDAAIAAAEARSVGVNWTFAPMVDIARDPRWGRIMEGAGEDPYLGSLLAAAYVRGFQGTDMSRPDKVMACAKHFAAYGAAEGGRDYNTVDMSELRFRRVYLPPFKAARDAGVRSFMTAFDDFNGVPSTANPFLLRQVLRTEWKYDGLVVSDYTAVKELEPHGLAADDKQAAMYAINAGTEIEMMSRTYAENVPQLLKEGKVSMQTVDNAVRDILRAKFRLGLFDHPFVDETLEAKTLKKPEFLQAAKEAAVKSFVLLKNDHDTLPIQKNIRSIAVIGSLAADKANTLDWWAGDAKAEESVTILEGIRKKVGPSIKVNYAAGCDLTCSDDLGTAEAVRTAKDSDFTVIVAGETRDVSGEAASRSNIDLPGKQLDLIKAIHATGKPYVVVLKNGRPLTINWIAENSPAVLETWHSGTMGGAAVADVLFGDANPSGKLTATFPRSVGQIPIYYAHKNTGRPIDPNNRYTSKYLDVPNTPLYPFGYGLSYTHFEISDLKLDHDSIPVSGSVRVSVAVKNTGARSGDEIVQLYIHENASPVTRPVRELKGFKRVTLAPGETRHVDLVVGPKELTELDRDLKPIVEPGEYQIFVGDSSDATLSADLYVGVPRPGNAATANSPGTSTSTSDTKPSTDLTASDVEFIDDLEQRSFRFFWEHSDPITGLTLDRARTNGDAPKKGDTHFQIASIASTGFALTSLCAAADHRWVSAREARQRARNTLDFLADRAANKNGWFYHWMDAPTGGRRWNSEISSIDTALLLGGVLTVRQCFGDDPNIKKQADNIYERIDFGWMLNGDKYLLSHGWRPENGWIPNRWHDYSEEMILYLLAIGSPTHPIDPESWYKWTRDWRDYGGYRYVAAVPPLFIHQFSHAWVDFRGRREGRDSKINYFENSIAATRAQRQFFIDVLSKQFPTYGANIWGLTASDYPKGYIAWGAPPRDPATDGTVVPAAPAGSLMFTPEISLAALKEMKAKYGDKIFGRYGYADAFNPKTGWVDPDVIGIDLGITLLSAENLRSGKIWNWFMLNPEIVRAMDLVGLRKT